MPKLLPPRRPPRLPRPDPAQLRGICPYCGDEVFSVIEEHPIGAVIVWKCAGNLVRPRRCAYRRTL